MKLNSAAAKQCQLAIEKAEIYRLVASRLDNGTRLIDFGVNVPGGISAGLLLAQICMADRAKVELIPAEASISQAPQVQVYTDFPVEACMASQYAGWPIQSDKFFAMGSGPMRSKRGREPVLERLKLIDEGTVAVGVLECDRLPNESVCRQIAEECSVSDSELVLCVAPTRSIAGTIQVVARSIETSLHKLFELGFDLRQVLSGYGSAPLPPPAKDFALGIGRTNDAILYGGRVTLWVDADDQQIELVGEKVPSQSSKDWGRPFVDVFRDYQFDFYRVDPGLFSPAVVSFHNLRSGRTWHYGALRPDVIAKSFAAM